MLQIKGRHIFSPVPVCTECISKSLAAAVEKLALCLDTLKLDLIIVANLKSMYTVQYDSIAYTESLYVYIRHMHKPFHNFPPV